MEASFKESVLPILQETESESKLQLDSYHDGVRLKEVITDNRNDASFELTWKLYIFYLKLSEIPQLFYWVEGMRNIGYSDKQIQEDFNEQMQQKIQVLINTYQICIKRVSKESQNDFVK